MSDHVIDTETVDTPAGKIGAGKMNAYTPRRCGKRWLDADCPREILAITNHPQFDDQYTIYYAEPMRDGRDVWINFLACSEDGRVYHGEQRAHEVAAYRYRFKHRYTKWSTLPDAVKNAVRRDIKDAAEWAAKFANEGSTV